MPQSYESLSTEEKASLWGCLVADDQLGRLMLERLSPLTCLHKGDHSLS